MSDPVGGLEYYRREAVRLRRSDFIMFLYDIGVITIDDAIYAMEYNQNNGHYP